MNRIGIGQDSHRFAKKTKPLIMGGVKIEESGGFEGNSDGDVILHSLCNALSSAIGGDSISTWSDEMCDAGIIDSKKYLEIIADKAREEGFKVENISIVIEAKKPYIDLKDSDKMKQTIAGILGILKKQVGITFTSGEGLTPFGKGLGLQAISVVLLKKSEK